MRLRSILAMLLWTAIAIPALADVKPNAICTDGMVLQQQSKVKIWGTAEKGEKVSVKFRDKEASTTADDKGKWVVTLDSGEAGGPFPMTLTGNNTLQYKNVMVGEVWICSGQSNMEMAVGSCDKGDKDYAQSAKPNPMLRTFNVAKNAQYEPVEAVSGSWVEASPGTVNGFTAVGYFFGRDLQQKLNVPVGLIHTSWGGTRAEAWTSKGVLNGSEMFKNEHPGLDKQMEAFKTDPQKVKNPLHANSPSALYNGMIYPLLNCSIKGAIWYQGESNAGAAYKYRTLFPMMIENWRKDFAQGDFPFLFVQLAPFGSVAKTPGESDWAELREAQALTLKLKNTGMAVITDVGNEYDIHPTPKRPVGERLSLAARANVYGEKIEYSGPMYESKAIEGNKIVLSFTHIGKGLVSNEMEGTLERKDKNNGPSHFAWRVKPGTEGAPLMGFTICGEDKKFYDAKAEIMGDKVVVSCDQVVKPVAVRYAWAMHPVCNLFNKDGLPASPFRTDDFPVSTQPKN
jgi:sialate O-acetylesterase